MKKKRLFLGMLMIALSLSIYALPAKQVSLSLSNVSIETFLDEVKKQTGTNFLYNSESFVGLSKISVKANNEPLENLLNRVLTSHSLTFVEKGGIVVIQKKSGQTQPSQGKRFSIKVTDENYEPLPGATIAIKNTNKETKVFITTDGSGSFQYDPKGDEETLTATYLGYEPKSLSTKGGKSDFVFQLQKSAHSIDEVVVTGIFNKPKVSFTGAATIITREDIEKVGNRNLLKTLTYLDPSFDVLEANQYGSDPNQTLNIEIRGSSSIGSVSDLQTNVRNQRNIPLFILDGFEVTAQRVMDMNQADVESVVILKDASATAIYGSRGANGVVVITSIQPKAGKLRVSYQAGANFEIPDLSSYHLLNSFEKIDLEKMAGLYTSSTLSTQLTLDQVYNQNLLAANEGVNTDWIHKPVQTGVGQYHKIDIGGGIDQFRYVLNFSYNALTGAMKGSSRDNMNGSMTINYIMKNFRLSNNLSLGFNNAKVSPYGDFSAYTTMNPYWRPFDTDGAPTVSYYNFGSTSPTPNPIYDALQTSFSKSDYTNIRNTTIFDIDLMKNLRLSLNLGFSQQRGGSDVFKSPKSTDYTVITSTAASDRGAYTQGTNKQTSYQGSVTLSWAKVIGKHSIYMGANAQMMETDQNTSSVTVKGFMNDQMNDISSGNSYSGSRPTTSESTVRSVGSTETFNYNYDNQYFLDASYRLDGASSFGKYSRWAPFWSIGAGWDMSREKFIAKNLPMISQSKFRYSYGVTGSLNFEPYQALTTYQYNSTTQYTYLIGAMIEGYGNPNLKWQNTKQHDFGWDLALFNNRLVINANYYRKTTSNLLSDVYLPLSHGYSSYKENLGVVRNTGYDVMVSFNAIRSTENQFDWTIRGGVYHNQNTLVQLSEAIKRANELYANQAVSSGSSIYQYREGYSMDELYVYHSLGVDPATGVRLYQAEDGTITSSISGLKKIAVGNGQPSVNGRFGSTLRWKGLMADVSFGWRWGAKKLNSTLMSKVENAFAKNNVDRRAYTERWRKAGDISAYKDIASTSATYENDLFVFTEKTFTFNTLNLTYELPKSWIKRFSMERLAFSATMSDIFYISNIEQERGTNYPYTIKPTFSLSCTF